MDKRRASLLAGIRNDRERSAIEVLLGFAATPDGTFLRWPAQKAVADATGQSQPVLSNWLRKHAKDWLGNASLAQG